MMTKKAARVRRYLCKGGLRRGVARQKLLARRYYRRVTKSAVRAGKDPEIRIGRGSFLTERDII